MRLGIVMTDKDKEFDTELEDLFAQARANPPIPDATLMARVEADALDEIAARSKPTPAPRKSRGLFVGFGGFATFAGLASAAVAGVWIGYADPSTAILPASGLGFDSLNSLNESDDLGLLLPGYIATDDWSG